jgi:hypothetical protein
VPPAEKPSWPLPTKYKPVVVSPEKFNVGEAAAPLASVNDVIELALVDVLAL